MSRYFDDSDFLNQFFGQFRIFSKKDPKCMSIGEFRSAVRAVFAAQRQITVIEASLRSSLDNVSDDEFAEKLQDIAVLRNVIEKAMIILDDTSALISLRSKLKKRSKTRKRLKKRAAEIQIKNEEEKKDLEVRRAQMELRLKEIQIEIDFKKKEERVAAEINFVLKDVMKRKSEARKYLLLLDAVCKLREAREKSKAGRGELRTPRDFEIFMSSMEKLKKLWKDALSKYAKEEKELEENLKNKNSDNDEFQCKNEIMSSGIDDWVCVMFGDKGSIPLKRFQYDFEHFISVRKQWDQYIDPDEGSHLPMGWAIPPSPHNKWKLYLQK